MKKTLLTFMVLSFLFVACGKKQQEVERPTASGLYASKFESLSGTDSTHLYVMKNETGMEVCVTNLGARIVSVMVPDRTGTLQDVVLGFDHVDGYTDMSNTFGAVIGRYADRIAEGKFTLDRVNYTLRQNNKDYILDGGPRGFHTQFFRIEQPDSASLVCTYLSEDGQEGFPGNLQVTVTYKLTGNNALAISYKATTDRPTVINLTCRPYFNLSGDPNKAITDHLLYLDCSHYVPANELLIPTGKIEKVAGTPLDFTQPKAIGDRINDTTSTAIRYAKGYDLNYVLNKPGDMANPAVKLVCPASGICLEVFTTEPAIRFYTGNLLDGKNIGKKEIAYNSRAALCLDTQHFPDSPNQGVFPSTVLRPDTVFNSKSIYKFSVIK